MAEPLLENLLFGLPLSERGKHGDTTIPHLDAALRGIVPVIERELGHSQPVEQAILEWNRVIALPLDFCGVQAKRAALLFAIWRERDVRSHYRKRNPQLVADLERRLLPLVCPAFVANQAQSPDAFVAMMSVMHAMWSSNEVGAVQSDTANCERA